MVDNNSKKGLYHKWIGISVGIKSQLQVNGQKLPLYDKRKHNNNIII